MRAAHALAICMAAFSADVSAVELQLGFTEAPACAAAPKARKNDAQAPQKAAVSAIVEGRNTEDPGNREGLQTCAAAAAEKVSLRLLAAQPVDGNPLFKNIFLQCVEDKRLPVDVYFVAPKIEDKCDSKEKTSR